MKSGSRYARAIDDFIAEKDPSPSKLDCHGGQSPPFGETDFDERD